MTAFGKKSSSRFLFVQIALFLVCLLGFELSARADSVSIYGLQLSVDSLQSVDSNSVKISIFGDSRIISTETQGSFVLKKYCESPASLKRFETPKLLESISLALRAANFSDAAMLLRAISAERPQDAELIRAKIVELVDSPDSKLDLKTFFKEVLWSSGAAAKAEQGVLPLAAFFLSLWDLDWLRSNATSSIYRNSDGIYAFALERFKKALSEKDFDYALKISNALNSIFGLDDPKSAKIRSIYNRVDETRKAALEGKYDRLFPLVAGVGNDSELSNILSPFVLDLIHSQAAQAISGEQYSQALRLLSFVALDRRTPTTHQLTSKALQSLKPEDNSILMDNSVRTFLGTLAANDPQLKLDFRNALVRLAGFLVDQQKLSESEAVLNRLLSINPDPSYENDQVRIAQSKAYINLEDLAQFEAKYSEIQTSLPLSLRFNAMIFRFSHNPIAKSCAVLALALILSLSILHLRNSRSSSSKQSGSADSALEEEGPLQRPVFQSFARGLSPRRSEYVQCLQSLGLNPDAALKEIKTAYRNAVKEVHPDLNQKGDPELQQRFIELTGIYERIQILRSELGLDQES